MSTEFFIRAERSSDVDVISNVHRQAFGVDDRVPELVGKLRQIKGPFPVISFVACDAQGGVVGHVMLSHSWLDAPKRLMDVIVLSPLGVIPQAQKQGVGTLLLHHAVAHAKQTTAPILFLEGNPAYYKPRGFEPASEFGIRSPSLRIPKPALQMVLLPSYEDDMTGSLVYRDAFWELDCVGLR